MNEIQKLWNNRFLVKAIEEIVDTMDGTGNYNQRLACKIIRRHTGFDLIRCRNLTFKLFKIENGLIIDLL